MRLRELLAVLCVVVVVALALPRGADAGGWTPAQQRVIDKIYYYSDVYGADTALMLRIAYRETRFGLERVGDGGHSVGVFQWYDRGLWVVTPCYMEWGWNGRWNEDADIRCAAWAMSRGYQAHWRPWEWPAYSWLAWLPAPSWGWE